MNNIGNFRYWCQHVLPAVYDDSLSYYELLCKVQFYLNEAINSINDNKDAIAGLLDLYKQLEEYVDNYFENLDIETEINNKLDIMAGDGTLDEIINTHIFDKLNLKINNIGNDLLAYKQTNDERFTEFEAEFDGVRSDVVGIDNKLEDEITMNYIGGTKVSPVGNCTVLRVGDKTMLFDLGQQTTPAPLMNFLHSNGITKIDYISVSHYHSDHIGGGGGEGLSYLFNSDIDMSQCVFFLPHHEIDWSRMVGDLSAVQRQGETIQNIITARGNKIVYPTEGFKLILGRCELEAHNLNPEFFNSYYPDVQDYKGAISTKTNYNNFSMIWNIKYAKHKIGTYGDISYRAQLLNASTFMNCNVIDVPHHGLERECANIVLNSLNPDVAVICGSTFHDPLEMNTPIAVQCNVRKAMLHYTTGTPVLTVRVGFNYIKLEPENVNLFNVPIKPLTSSSGITIPLVYEGGTEDFDELVSGEYLFQNSDVKNRFANAPGLTSGGKLVCIKTNPINYVRQFYISATNEYACIATRRLTDGRWSKWVYLNADDSPKV